MKLVLLLWKREGIAIIRNTYQVMLLIAIVFLSIYAIYYGNSIITKQQQTIENVKSIEKNEFDSYQNCFVNERTSLKEKELFNIASKPAYAWYRHGYHAILTPHSLAHLSLGQRDIEPFYHKLTATSLYYQLFENKLANPLKLHIGNFDLSFVFIYLFPLLIIVFTYGLYAEEKENGMLPLLMLQTVGLRKILLIRISFYYVLIITLAVFLSSIGFFIATNPAISSTILWIIAIICYLSFWFALLFFLISFKQNSSLTAMSAAALWLLFLIVLPAILNVYATIAYPIDNISLADITRRRSLENEEDINEAKAVIHEYLKHRKDLEGANTLINTNTMPKAYAAFTALNDNHHRQEVNEYFNQIKLRQKWISLFQWGNPAVNTQNILNEISQTDAVIFQDFHKSINSFHKKITRFYFDKLFLNKRITNNDYKKLPTFTLNTDNTTKNQHIKNGLIEILIITFSLLGLSLIIFNQTTFFNNSRRMSS